MAFVRSLGSPVVVFWKLNKNYIQTETNWITKTDTKTKSNVENYIKTVTISNSKLKL